MLKRNKTLKTNNVMKTAYMKLANNYNARNNRNNIEQPAENKPKIVATIPGTRIIDQVKTAYLAMAQKYNAGRKQNDRNTI